MLAAIANRIVTVRYVNHFHARRTVTEDQAEAKEERNRHVPTNLHLHSSRQLLHDTQHTTLLQLQNSAHGKKADDNVSEIFPRHGKAKVLTDKASQEPIFTQVTFS